MKKLYTFIFGILLAANIFAQGQIQSFVVSPSAPTTADDVKIYATVMFTTGGCAVANQGSGTTGSVSTGYALHCLGMLSMICYATDTFDLGFLPVGPHVFKFTLSSGMGGPPCSPGFAPDDNDSVNFTVLSPTGISSIADNRLVSISPNPMHTSSIIKIDAALKLNNAQLKIVDVQGKTIRFIEAIETNEILLEKDKMQNGIYFYQLIQNDKILSTGKFVIE